MTFEEICQKIESHDFLAEVGIANDFNSFLRLVVRHQAVADLLGSILPSDDCAEDLFFRAIQLAKTGIDVRYLHPYDGALTVYLLVLGNKNQDLAKILSEVVLKTANCWWSVRMAKHQLFERLVNHAGIGLLVKKTRGDFSQIYSQDVDTEDAMASSDPRFIFTDDQLRLLSKSGLRTSALVEIVQSADQPPWISFKNSAY